jgi:hypothetical protein
MLVAATNVGGNNFENDAVFAFAIPKFQLREIDTLNFYDAGAHISYPTVACHALTLLGFRAALDVSLCREPNR